MIRILHLDGDLDHHEWTRHQLAKLARDVELVRIPDLDQALLSLNSGDFQCILTDDQQPGVPIQEIASEIYSVNAGITIIAMTDRDLIDGDSGVEALLEGVEFVPFGSYEVLLEFIRGAEKKAGTEARTASSTAPAATRNKETELLNRLSRREAEVLLLIARGNSNKEIAYELGISYHTVVNHVRNLFEKLEVHNRTEATRIALRNRESVAGPLGMGLPDKIM